MYNKLIIYFMYMTEVVLEDTFESAIRLIKENYDPVVLDFASATNAGGGWKTKSKTFVESGTQEESLCRRSNLGLLLEKLKYPMSRDASYYVKNVIIERDKKGNKLNDVYKCAVIASELKSIALHKSEYLQKRICDLYEIAIKNKHDVIILGAWGCGAFGETDDDREILAKEFKKALEKYDTKIKSVFALIKKDTVDIFKNILIE